MKSFLCFLLFLWCCFSFPLLGQVQDSHVPGQLIVMMQPGWETTTPKLPPLQLNGQTVELTEIQCLSRQIRIYLFEFDATQVPEEVVLETVRTLPQVQLAQFNHYVEERGVQATFPNDSLFGNQWDMHNTGQSNGTIDADIDAPEAWDITTGGITALGDTIVVAVIDGGCDLSHIDLNLWKNHGEIPNNGIDDDNNGYIDDVDGWNAYNNTGNINSDSHGTHVSGTIAAKGDNQDGISGVNWNAQVMTIAGSSGNEAIVVRAYDYALTMRALYNQTGGKEGAFVVATNSSFGVNFGQPANFPIWCAMYDSMGMEGILSAAATMNINADVDVTGDVPTACASPWMIAVTNTTRHDNLNNSAAYGLTTIDLGAPGSQTLSTTPNDNYSAFTGTSMATPHVAGAVAFMLSAPCPGFISQYKIDPANMALVVRDYIFQGVDSIQALDGITVTEGRLNLFNSIQLIQQDCSQFSECLPVSQVSFSQRTDSSLYIDWLPSDSALTYDLFYREVDSTSWIQALSQDSLQQFWLNGLESCTSYEVQFRSHCSFDSSQLSNTFVVTTEGCCEAPSDFQVESDSISELSWNRIYGGTAYQIRYRPAGDSSWAVAVSLDTSAMLSFLEPCTDYELQVATLCDKITHDFSSSIFLTTLGCEICVETNYCIDPPSSQIGYIDSVGIGPLHLASGDNSGFGEWVTTDQAFDPFALHSVTLVPASTNDDPIILWRIWIDLNQDSVFSDSTEVVFQTQPTQGIVTGNLMLPGYVPLGRTRMRVAAKILTTDGAFPEACGGFDLGEIEDFCIRFDVPCATLDPLQLSRRPDSSGIVDLSWSSLHPDYDYLLEYRPVDSSHWQHMIADTFAVSLGPLPACQFYEFRVRPICEGDSGAIATTFPIWTAGCGDCRDTDYCQSLGQDAHQAWIDSIQIGNVQNASGPNQGYGDFLDQSLDLILGDSIHFSLFPGLDTSEQAQYWLLWIDLDQDGTYNSSTELVYHSLQGSSSPVHDTFILPDSLLTGPSRLRIQMFSMPTTDACSDSESGEVEDYCVNILPAGHVSLEDEWSTRFNVFPNPVTDILHIQADIPFERVMLYDLLGKLIWDSGAIRTESLQMSMEQWPKGMYQLRVESGKGMFVKKLIKSRK